MRGRSLVSVVTATYNMGQHVGTAVQSVLDQTYDCLEIHVIDDGSTDNTEKIIKKFTPDPRVHYHYQDNRGQAAAKNRGIREAKGEYVAFLDADDMWLPKKLEKQLPLFAKSSKIGVVYSDELYMDENNEVLPEKSKKRYYSGNITESLFLDNFVNFNSTVVKKECFDRVGVFDESLRMSIDWDLWLRISTKYHFAYLDEPTFQYRRWAGQMSRNFDVRYECILTVMNKFLRDHRDLLSKKTLRKGWAITYFERGWKFREYQNKKMDAFRYFLKSLKEYPAFLPAWKGIAKLGVKWC